MWRKFTGLACIIGLTAGAVACSASGTSTPTALRTAAPRGARPAGRSTFWRVKGPSGAAMTIEQYPAPGPGLHPTVILFPGSAGWSPTEELEAATWATRGFDGVAVCWFRPSPIPPDGIDCPDGPPVLGVSAAALPDVRALVDAVKSLPGVDPARVALSGFSRGGGIVALLATRGGREPVIGVSGLYDPATFSAPLPAETNVIAHASGIRAPMLLQYGRDDTFVDWRRNSVALGDAIRRAHVAPAPQVTGYPGGHDVSFPLAVLEQEAFLRRTLG